MPLPEIHHVSKNPGDMGIIPATEVPASDEVIDAIADIEMLRRTTWNERCRDPGTGRQQFAPRPAQGAVAGRVAPVRQEQGTPDAGPERRPGMSDERQAVCDQPSIKEY